MRILKENREVNSVEKILNSLGVPAKVKDSNNTGGAIEIKNPSKLDAAWEDVVEDVYEQLGDEWDLIWNQDDNEEWVYVNKNTSAGDWGIEWVMEGSKVRTNKRIDEAVDTKIMQIKSDVQLLGTNIILEAGDFIQVLEEVDSSKVIKDLIDTNWSKDKESAGKAVALLKGLAFSDDPKANKFIKDLDKLTNGMKVEENIITIEKDIIIEGVLFEKGDEISIVKKVTLKDVKKDTPMKDEASTQVVYNTLQNIEDNMEPNRAFLEACISNSVSEKEIKETAIKILKNMYDIEVAESKES